MRILAIDDSEVYLEALQTILSQMLPSAGVITALNGSEGLHRAVADDPDVILLDISMPGIDGYEVCRRLKENGSLRMIPVLFLTAANTDRESRQKALDAGGEAFLSKTCDPFELVAQVQSMAKIKAANRVERGERERLEAQVAERTAALGRELAERKRGEEERARLQAQLLHSQKMESVGRLAGGVAHDFNNMLGVIMAGAELALDKLTSSDPLREDLNEILRAAGHSSDITRQLLAFARKQAISPKVLDLNETVETMLKMLRRLIGEDIKLDWRPGPDLWRVRMDPSQLDQILANLCVNARDAIAGVGRIGLETGNAILSEADCVGYSGIVPGRYVLLTVSDDGCGMAKETVDRLFEPFFTTKEKGKGTGLGLATVYGVVRQNEGFIDVQSEPGQGTTFRIYLPRQAARRDQAPKVCPAASGAPGHETVLVVEDEPAILRTCAMILESQGYTALAASMPAEALRLVREYPGKIHLLMTDVVMPEMNGRDLARNVLSLQPQIRCLFMSGYTADVIAHRGVLGEGLHFINKPFTRHDLMAKVREVLDEK